MSKIKRTKKEMALRSLIDGVSTKVYDKNRKLILNGKDYIPEGWKKGGK